MAFTTREGQPVELQLRGTDDDRMVAVGDVVVKRR